MRLAFFQNFSIIIVLSINFPIICEFFMSISYSNRRWPIFGRQDASGVPKLCVSFNKLSNGKRHLCQTATVFRVGIASHFGRSVPTVSKKGLLVNFAFKL